MLPPLFLKYSVSFHIRGIRRSAKQRSQRSERNTQGYNTHTQCHSQLRATIAGCHSMSINRKMHSKHTSGILCHAAFIILAHPPHQDHINRSSPAGCASLSRSV